jgi:hypothetical protein
LKSEREEKEVRTRKSEEEWREKRDALTFEECRGQCCNRFEIQQCEVKNYSSPSVNESSLV